MMRGDLTIKIFQLIGQGLDETSLLISAILRAGYGASDRRLEYFVNQEKTRQLRRKREESERQRIRSMLYYLKQDGLLSQRAGKWQITLRGKEKLQALFKLPFRSLPRTSHHREASANLTIVIFDIPERERRKRHWLRSTLATLGFTILQKSVWAGKIKLPPEFIQDLSALKLLGAVEIFSVDRHGTIRRLP